jgi:Reverse transcriptase (RNA-dependent DNA polymerase)
LKHFKTILKFNLVGAGLGEGFQHTGELHALKFKDAMPGDNKDKWKEAVEAEFKQMIDNKVWIPIKISNLPENFKTLSSTWAMKKKANGQFRACIIARGFLQEDEVHFNSDLTAVPVTNETTIKIVLALTTMADWNAQVIDVKGEFLKGQITDDVVFVCPRRI